MLYSCASKVVQWLIIGVLGNVDLRFRTVAGEFIPKRKLTHLTRVVNAENLASNYSVSWLLNSGR